MVTLSTKDFTREHAAYIEHLSYTFAEIHQTLGHWKVIGRIEQKYKDGD